MQQWEGGFVKYAVGSSRKALERGSGDEVSAGNRRFSANYTAEE